MILDSIGCSPETINQEKSKDVFKNTLKCIKIWSKAKGLNENNVDLWVEITNQI